MIQQVDFIAHIMMVFMLLGPSRKAGDNPSKQSTKSKAKIEPGIKIGEQGRRSCPLIL
jgi:hypothetical protein